MLKLIQIKVKNSVSTSQKTHCETDTNKTNTPIAKYEKSLRVEASSAAGHSAIKR